MKNSPISKIALRTIIILCPLLSISVTKASTILICYPSGQAYEVNGDELIPAGGCAGGPWYTIYGHEATNDYEETDTLPLINSGIITDVEISSSNASQQSAEATAAN